MAALRFDSFHAAGHDPRRPAWLQALAHVASTIPPRVAAGRLIRRLIPQHYFTTSQQFTRAWCTFSPALVLHIPALLPAVNE